MKFRQKIMVYLLLFTVHSLTAFAQVVDIPDPHLRAAVSERLGVNPDRITRDAMQRLTWFTAYSQIRNLEGLDYAINLQLLELEGNRTYLLYFLLYLVIGRQK